MTEALSAEILRKRDAEVDEQYAAYDTLPVDSHDEWGSIEQFRDALLQARIADAGHADN